MKTALFNTKVLLSTTVIIAAAALIIGATYAFYSDTETSHGNVLGAGALDLLIDNESYYNGVLHEGTTWLEKNLETGDFFYNFTDVKPGDYGEDTISLHIKNNDAWVCSETTITADDDVTCSEPENADDPSCTDPNAPGNTDEFDGELADFIEIMWWADDGDNVLEADEDVIDIGAIGLGPQNTPVIRAIADSLNNIFSGLANDPLAGGDTEPIHYITKAWCFGNLTPAGLPPFTYSGPDDPTNDGAGLVGPATSNDGGFSCDPGVVVGNAALTDKVMMDVSFSAVQSRGNSSYVCSPQLTPTNTPTPTPPQFSCEPADAIYASSASDNDQGLRKNSTAVLASRSTPANAFGINNTSGAAVDPAVVEGTFFSLGFPLGGNTASIVFGFAEPFFNGPGDDLQVFEVTGVTVPAYPDELVKTEASANPSGPWTLLAAAAVRDEAVDLGPLSSAQYVRLTDVSSIALFEATADAYDVDAVKAFCTAQEL